MLWGTVIAFWATGAVVATAMRNLDIKGAEDAPSKLRAMVAPWKEGLEARFAPLKSGLSLATVAGSEMREDTSQSALVQRLKAKLMTS